MAPSVVAQCLLVQRQIESRGFWLLVNTLSVRRGGWTWWRESPG